MGPPVPKYTTLIKESEMRDNEGMDPKLVEKIKRARPSIPTTIAEMKEWLLQRRR
jgi:hypothetical protein